jgi:uncharacterized lipoprotein NlpE involved in copper resistance
MSTFRQKIKKIPAFFLFIAIFSTYNPVFAETTETKDQDAHHHAEKSLDWPGIYNGLTPCADCIGVKTTLALNKNNSYILITQHLGKSDREFTEKGKFTFGDKANTIVLTSRDGSITRQYLVGENMLTQLDSNGNRIAGKNADSYNLRRNDVTANPPKHSH